MKVLFLSNEASQSGSAYAHRLEKLRSALNQHGIQTGFLSLREQPVPRPLLAHPLNVPLIRKSLSEYDFVHAGGAAAYTAAFLKRHTRARIIHDVHGDILCEAKLELEVHKNPLSAYRVIQAWIAESVAYRYSDYFLVVCRPLQQRLMDEHHIPAHRIGLVRNGVDLSLFTPSSQNGTGEFVVCYAGGFQDWQGAHNLIQAAELVSIRNFRLKVVGFTPRDATLKSRIASRLGDKVQLVDRVEQRELISHLAAAHVLVIPRPSHPAVEAAFPTKFSEFLALAKPVIVCDVDQTARLVEQHHCGLVSQPDPAALAATISAVSKLPRAELKRMGQNARRLAEREFSWDVIGQAYAELLRRWQVQ